MKSPIVNHCEFCHKDFIAKKNPHHKQPYCSRECSYKGRHNGEDRQCILCNATFYFSPNRLIENKSRGKYCSNACRLEDWSMKSLKAGKPGNYPRNAWKVYEKKCYDCGYKEEPRIIVIHHIDGNRKNGKVENLIPLCQNCHCLRHIKMSGNHRLPSYRGD